MHRAPGSFSSHAAVPPKENGNRAAPFSYPPTPHDWDKIKHAIYEYYVVQDQPLHTVRGLLRTNYNFKASERMIKARLSKWEYTKNAKREDWAYLAILHDIRKRENRPTVFEIRGHRKTAKDLQRFIRNQNISPENFLAESQNTFRAKGSRFPDYIRATTPDLLSDLIYSPSADTTLTDVRSPSPGTPESAKESTYGLDIVGSSSDNVDERIRYSAHAKFADRDIFEHQCPIQSDALEDDRVVLARTQSTNMTASHSLSRGNHNSKRHCFDQTSRELIACSTQLITPTPLIHQIGHNDMRCWSIISPPVRSDDVMEVDVDVCVRCDQPSGKHFPSLDLFEPRQGQRNILNDDNTVHNLHLPVSMQEEGAWVWVSLCFLSCMSLRRNDEVNATRVLKQAAQKFEKLLCARDKMLLTAAGLVITILHMHDQDKISTHILDHAYSVAERVLPSDDPIRITILYLALSADSSGERFGNTLFGSAQLLPVWEKLKKQHPDPEGHPYIIAAHFNYAWMLKHEGKIREAEWHARQVHRESTEYFGQLHMQTITSLSVIAGCLALQAGSEAECIETYRAVINDVSQILGVIHPFTLEAQRRLADKLQYVPGQTTMVLSLHRTILFGRATMLGRPHTFTRGQRQDYEKLLQRHDKWEDAQGNPSREQQEIVDLFTKDSEEGWEVIEGIRGDSSVMSSGFNTTLGHPLDAQWCRIAMARSRSRSASPGSGNEYEAY